MNDDPSPDRTPKRSLVSRTSVVTMLAIGGVALAGTAAIAANIGILNSTSDDELGTLTPVQLETSSTTSSTIPAQVIDVFVDDVTTSTVPGAPEREGAQYRVDDAGLVTATVDGGAVRIADVAPAPGWTWTMAQERPDTATLVFTGGGRTLVFTATVGRDGTLRTDVTEPVVITGTSPSTPRVTSAPPTSDRIDDGRDDDREHEFEDDDDRDEDHDDHDDDRDDDHEEYEGRDDDD